MRSSISMMGRVRVFSVPRAASDVATLAMASSSGASMMLRKSHSPQQRELLDHAHAHGLDLGGDLAQAGRVLEEPGAAVGPEGGEHHELGHGPKVAAPDDRQSRPRMLSTSPGSTSVSARNARTTSAATAGVVARFDSASTLASFHRRAPVAVSASAQRAARTPGTLLAAMETPVPVQQQTMPASASPAATASPTAASDVGPRRAHRDGLDHLGAELHEQLADGGHEGGGLVGADGDAHVPILARHHRPLRSASSARVFDREGTTLNNRFAFLPMRSSTELLGDPEALRARLAEDSYLYFPGLLDRERVLAVRQDVLDVIKRLGWVNVRGDGIDVCKVLPLREEDDEFIEGYKQVQRLQSFHELAHEPELIDAMQQVLGPTAFPHPLKIARLAFPDHYEASTPPHQDFPNNQGTESLTATWIPITDIEPELGGLAVLRGSHRWGLLPLEGHIGAGNRAAVISPEMAEACRWVTTDFAMGDVLLFPSLAVHASLHNASEFQMRLSVDFRYQLERQPLTARVPGAALRQPDLGGDLRRLGQRPVPVLLEEVEVQDREVRGPARRTRCRHARDRGADLPLQGPGQGAHQAPPGQARHRVQEPQVPGQLRRAPRAARPEAGQPAGLSRRGADLPWRP